MKTYDNIILVKDIEQAEAVSKMIMYGRNIHGTSKTEFSIAFIEQLEELRIIFSIIVKESFLDGFESNGNIAGFKITDLTKEEF